ncbi:HEAT repeat domain-containing protein [Roseimicrobium gellanilyticum]|nr:tetratricopeptide repeat protein [Roseimicrobium gellanilyticum]
MSTKRRGLPVMAWVVLALVVAIGAGWVLAKREKKESKEGDGVAHQPTPSNSPTPASSQSPLEMALAPLMEPEGQAHAGYAGSASCRECHQEIYDQWIASNHGMAERPLNDKLDKEAFDPAHVFTHGTQTSEACVRNGKPAVKALGFDNHVETYSIERVIGHDPLRQFLVKGPGNRLQTLEATWDPHKKEWFNVYGNEDRKPGEWGHWTGRGMVWNTMCASCHNTRVRKNYDEKTDTFHTTMAEMTVSCGSCHGPMKEHVEWRRKYPDKALKDPTIVKHTPEQKIETCATCHARRTEITGDFKPGDSFFDHHVLAIVDESNLFYPDGQVWDEDYEYSAFRGSKMHAAGVKCLDCHNPHTAKVFTKDNSLCMRCHVGNVQPFPKAPAINMLTHTFHQLDSAGSQCINCHMPQTTYMQRHPRHDHGFTIPDPLLTKQFGIPNACNRCHTDKDVDWSLAAVEKWYGDKMNRPERQRTQVIASAKRGDPAARNGLLALLASDKESGSWKGTAIRMLDPWMTDPAVYQAVMKQATHADPVVRTAVARALEPLLQQGGPPEARSTLHTLLQDPVRSVRTTAAWSLKSTLDLSTQQGKELLHMLDHNADMPSGQMQKGAFWFARNEPERGLEHFLRAAKFDGGSAGIRHELAVAYSLVGKPQDALRELQEAIKLDPRQAEYQFKLALAWNELGDMDQTIKALEETVKLDPRHPRAWFNLGLARNAKKDTAGAIAALRQGEVVNPADPTIPYARATIHAQLGQTEEARQAAMRALQIQPNYTDARQLLMMLQRGPMR